MTRAVGTWAPLTGPARAVAMEVLLRGPVSRSELARRLGLSPATLTRLTRPLLEAGLFVEGDQENDGRTGRPSKPLDIARNVDHFVGVNLTGVDATAVVTTLRAEVVASARAALSQRTPEAVVGVVDDLVGQLRAEVPAISALSVSVGGHVVDHRVVTRAPFLGWTSEIDLAALTSEATGLPTVVDNDLLALTRAEHWFGAGRNLDRFAVLTTGASVGYGLVMQDEVIESPDAGIGLVGHFPLDPHGPECPDGHRGCANSMLSIPAICARVGSELGRDVGYDEALELAAGGDPSAGPIVAASGRALGRLIAAIANLTMVTAVIVTGEGSRLAQLVGPEVRQGIQRDRDPRAGDVTVDVHPVDFTKHARGAAVTAIQLVGFGPA